MRTAAMLILGVVGLVLHCPGAIPDNDSFATRITLTGTNLSTSGSNVDATRQQGEPDPSFAGGKSVWWSWTAPMNGSLTLSTVGSGFDTLLTVFTGSVLSNLTLVAFNDTESNASMVTFNVAAGTEYQIDVDGAFGAAGNIVLQLTLGPTQPPPPNDNFADRITIVGTHLNNIPGTNVGATVEPGEPFHADGIGMKSVWWTWTAPSSGGLTLTTQGSAIDTVLAVYTGSSVSNLTMVGANDEDPLSPSGYQSRVTCNVQSNVTYQIAVDGYEGDAGDIRLRLDLGSVFPTPGNNNFANRSAISGTSVTTSGTNVGATLEPGEPMHLVTLGGKSVWWTWTAPLTGVVELTTANSAIDTILCVYQGNTLTNLVFVAGNDEASETESTSLAYFNASSGANYQIVVDGYDGAEGVISLRLTLYQPADPVPANNNFANRIAITGTNTTVAGSNIGATLETGEAPHLGYYGGQSVWWRWTSPAPGFVTMDTIGSLFDTMLAVYTNTALTNLVEIAGDDDGAANHTSRVMFPTKSNVTYQIAVDGYDGDAGNVSLHVSFTPASYTLSMTTNPASAGSVSLNPLPDQNGKYAPGTVVTLTALPISSYNFSNWTGAVVANNNPLLLTMNSNRSLSAGFTLLPAPTLVPWLPQSETSISTSGFRLLLSGSANSPYAIEHSTNLADWTAFQTNQASLIGPTEVWDTGATNKIRRFYRARRLP